MSRYFNDFSDTNGDSLEHHDILGIKWRVRRYQNKDGSLTSTGKELLKKIGEITITGNRGKSGKRFSYGNNTAELYDDWTYNFQKKKRYK